MLSKKTFYESLMSQHRFIIENFQELVLDKQTRQCPFPKIYRRFRNGKDVMIALSATGSFLSERELPQEYRMRMLELMDEFSRENGINLQIHLASSIEDVVRAFESGVLDDIRPFVKHLNLTNFLGLESIDDFARNVLFNKLSTRDEFERAIDIQSKFGIGSAAFVFCGFHSMTESEILRDAMCTIDYLVSRKVSPVLMTPNLQEYTFNHLLYRYGKYRLVEPRTMMRLLETLTDKCNFDEERGIDPWFMLMEGNFPRPALGVFDNSGKVTCSKCSGAIHRAIRQVRRTYSKRSIAENADTIENCECKALYENTMQRQDNCVPLSERARENIEFASLMKEQYISELEADA
jgi:radical SAM enzyme (TIGR01210 family)